MICKMINSRDLTRETLFPKAILSYVICTSTQVNVFLQFRLSFSDSFIICLSFSEFHECFRGLNQERFREGSIYWLYVYFINMKWKM